MCQFFWHWTTELIPAHISWGWYIGGCESAVYLETMPADHMLIKLDFTNAFNSIHRQNPRILCFLSLSIQPAFPSGFLEGAQQSDPIGLSLFSNTIQLMLRSLHSPLNPGYLDDVTLNSDCVFRCERNSQDREQHGGGTECWQVWAYLPQRFTGNWQPSHFIQTGREQRATLHITAVQSPSHSHAQPFYGSVDFVRDNPGSRYQKRHSPSHYQWYILIGKQSV